MIPDVSIVGAGLIGLATALELRRRGAEVTVFERDAAGGAASWAGAGMLAPYSEAIADPPLAELCAASLQRYPAFVAALLERTGLDVALRLDGTLHPLLDPGDRSRLEALHPLAGPGGARWLSRADLLAAEPMVSARAEGALLFEGEGQVDNRRLGRALIAAARELGVRIEEGVGEIAVEADERRVLGLATRLGFRSAPVVVNAAGAWAGTVPGLPPAAAVPVRPKKGQMLALAVPRGFARRLVWGAGVYLVPRADGRLLVGATVEDAGFDQRVTAEGIAALLNGALRAAPALGSFTLSETWAGLRPDSPDGRPYLGPGAVSGYFVAGGHYRNGILLTPITAELLADAIEGRTPALDLTPFAPSRPGAPACADPSARPWNLSA